MFYTYLLYIIADGDSRLVRISPNKSYGTLGEKKSAKQSRQTDGQSDLIIFSTCCSCTLLIIGKIEIDDIRFTIKGDTPTIENWEQCGLRFNVLEGTLSSSDEVEIHVKALAGGKFKFPENTKLVSAVYEISVPNEDLICKPLELQIQHCIDLTSEEQTERLKFAIASLDRASLLEYYIFNLVNGGKFEKGNWYGAISLEKFCLVCIVGEVSDPVPGGKENDEGDDDQPEENQSNDNFSSDESDSDSSSDHEGW